MAGTARIRWDREPRGSWTGRAGTREGWDFDLWQSRGGQWVLTCPFVFGNGQSSLAGTDPEKLKVEAERLLEEFVSSLGASVPDEPATERKLPLIGRELMLVRNLATQIADKGVRGHAVTPLSDYGEAGRGFHFEVLIHEDRVDTRRVAKVTVVLDRVEESAP